ncbi:hypothetical protein [Deinococcus radiotolerans]|uniref:Uncharacterized protein n=1 Tax=Deinococcus radiotolerans TaxID=1309407 RepID=A0ABQ2FNQ1_9DEIO|nr:hypothetical protein [Deinococcus radiotolerans]GGL11943.1 hypothetical protein GCM10010844_33260 [Deinococcus radiotolerans]
MRPLLLTGLLLSSTLSTPVGAQSAQGMGTATLRLSAPVGTTVEQRTTLTSLLKISDVKVTARPGASVPQKELDALRASFQGMGGQNTTITGKSFTRVAARDALGAVTLQQTLIQTIPGLPKALTTKTTQVLDANGALTDLKLSSDNADVNRLYQQMNLKELIRASNSSGTGPQLIGLPLTPGQSHETRQEVPLDSMMGALLGPVLQDPDADVDPATLTSTPLAFTSRLTFAGPDAAGRLRFTQTGTFSAWQTSVKNRAGQVLFQMSVSGGSVSGELLARPDGLPVSSSVRTTMQMQTLMTLDDVQVSATLTQDQTISVRQP